MPNLLRDNEMQVDVHLRECLRRRTNNIWIGSRKENSEFDRGRQMNPLEAGKRFHVKRVGYVLSGTPVVARSDSEVALGL